MQKLFIISLLFILCLSGGISFSQTQPVVVIPLNSNKISKQQTLNYSEFMLQFPGGGNAALNNNCITNNDNSNTGFVPLTLPMGAKIISVYANVFDDSSATSYQMHLGRSTIGPTGLIIENRAGVSGGTHSSQVVKENISPSTPETVGDGESYFLFFAPGAAKANGFCGAQVTIELP